RLSRLCFFLAFGAFALSFVIGFYPGAELQWGAFTACLFFFVFLISRGSIYRALAAVFLFFSLLFSLFGYWRGLHYQKWLAEHPINFVEFVNETEHNLQHIEVRARGLRNAGPGELAKGEHAALGFLTEPVPSQALVIWDDSIHHEVSVN